MASLTDYFKQNGYCATYAIGDRVRGHWNQIPITGTVGNDRLVSEATGPEITVHLDLPVQYQGRVHTFVIAKHADIGLLK
jgi:hypothetical protein